MWNRKCPQHSHEDYDNISYKLITVILLKYLDIFDCDLNITKEKLKLNLLKQQNLKVDLIDGGIELPEALVDQLIHSYFLTTIKNNNSSMVK